MLQLHHLPKMRGFGREELMPIFLDMENKRQFVGDMEIGTMRQVRKDGSYKDLFMMTCDDARVAVGFAGEELLQMMPHIQEFLASEGRYDAIKDIDITKMRDKDGGS